MSPPPSLVLLDLGGVVFPIDVARLVRSWTEAGIHPVETITERMRDDGVHHAFERGEISPADFRAAVCERLDLRLEAEEFDRLWNDIYLDPWPEMGSRKPERRCFESVLDALGATPEATLFVDDAPANVDAARSLGMDAFVAAGPAELAAGLRARGFGFDP